MLFNSMTVKNNIPLKYDELKLDFFTQHTNGSFNDKRVYLLYGDNGVGKTTLSRTLKKFNIFEDNENIIFEDYEGAPINLEENPSIFVYNEDYINNQFIFKSDDKLNAIIMTEETESIQDQIDSLEGKREELETELKEREEKNKNIEGKYIKNRETLLDSLRGPKSWAERDSKIRNKNSKQNTKVNEKALKKFKPFFEKYQKELFNDDKCLRNDYKTVIGSLLEANINEKNEYDVQLTKVREVEKISKIKLMYPNHEDSEIRISNILKSTIDEEEIGGNSDRLTEKIVQVYSSKGKDYLNSSLCTLEEHTDEDNSYCPICFKEYDEAYLNELKSQVSNLLSQEAKNNEARSFIKEINNERMSPLSDEDIESDEKIKAYLTEDYDELVQKIKAFNEVIEYYNNLLKEKTDKLYARVKIDSDYSLKQKYTELTSCIDRINEKITSHNESLKNTNQLIEDSQNNNNERSFLELFDTLLKYFSNLDKYEQIEIENETPESDINKLRDKISAVKERIGILESQKKQTKIAVDKINKKLNHITYNEDYLRIMPKEDKYYVLVNNNEIELSKLSTGQRNMISLCYFFAQINENQSRDTLYQEEILVILDDPVSSFDHSNKVGIMSLLRYEIGKMMLSNKDSKILIQTHDPGVIFDLEKIVSDIEEERSTNIDKFPNIDKISSLSKELRNISTHPIKKYKPANDYIELVTNVYNFAAGNYDEDESNPIVYSIGNNARRILEAYSTFNYNRNFTFLTKSDEILGTLESESLRTYYRNYMNRLILNNESHLKEKVQLVSESNSVPSFSYEEKKRVAKDTICFLYLIDPLHIKNNLRGFSLSIEREIKSWAVDSN